MAHWVHRRIAGLLAQVEPTTDVETRLWRVLEAAGAVVRWAEVPFPFCVHGPHGPVVTLPRHLCGEALLRALAHEFGHADGTQGAASWMFFQAENEYRWLVLARRWEMEEERIANQYAAVMLEGE